MTSKANILIVDDTPDNLRFLISILKKRGYTVRPASSGTQALSAIHTEQPDLILLDVMMEKMDGYEVCMHLKEDDSTKDIPIIFLTALTEVEHKVKGFEVGGIDYITKPFQAEEVLAHVETHLTLRKMQKQLEKANLKLQRQNVAFQRKVDRFRI